MTAHDKKLGGAGGSGPSVKDDTLFSDDLLEVTLGICEGPIGGLLNGVRTFYQDDTPLQLSNGENSTGAFDLHLYHGDDNASKVKQTLGGITSNIPVQTQLATGFPITRTTPSEQRNKIDYLEVRIALQQLYKTNDEGDQKQSDVEFKIEYRTAGGTTWAFFAGSEIIKISGKTTGGFVKEYRQAVPRQNQDWDVRVTMISADDHEEKIVSMSWDSLQVTTAENRSYDNLAVVRGLGRASETFPTIPTFSGVYATKLIKVPSNFDPATRHYDGFWDGTFKYAMSDSLFWVVYDLFDNEVYGVRKHWPFINLDRFAFYDAARWADELVGIAGESTFQPRYTFSAIFDQPKNAMELAHYICGVAGAVPVSDMNGNIGIKVDKPEDFVQIFAPQSVGADGFSYAYSDLTERKNDITVNFINPNLGFKQDSRRVFDQTLINRNGRVPHTLEALGCLDEAEAQRRAYRFLLQANSEITSVTYSAPRSAIALDLFDLVGIVDPDMGWGLSARVKATPTGSKVSFRDPVFEGLDVVAAAPATLLVQTSSGLHQLQVEQRPGQLDCVYITSGSWPVDAPDTAQVSLTSDIFGEPQKFRILDVKEDEKLGGDLYQITAQIHDETKFARSEGHLPSSAEVKRVENSQRPPKPEIVSLDSSAGHSVLGPDGVVNTRLYVELKSETTPKRLTFLLQYRELGEAEFTWVRSASPRFYVENTNPGHVAEIRAYTEYPNGVRSLATDLVRHTIKGRNRIPTKPTNWIGIGGVDTITLKGDPSPDADFREFRIYGTDSVGTVTLLDMLGSSRYVRKVPAGDDIVSYHVTAVNRQAYESDPTIEIFVTPTKVTVDDLSDTVAQSIAKAQEDAAAAAASSAQALTDAGAIRDDVNAANDAAIYSADQSRLAAEQAFTDADLAKTEALGARDETLTYRDEALTAGTAATEAVGTVSRVAGRGISALKDQFLGTDLELTYTGPAPVATPNEMYPSGRTLDFNAPLNTEVNATYSALDWPGLQKQQNYRVEVEFDLISGSLNGSGFRVRWVRADGTFESVAVHFPAVAKQVSTTRYSVDMIVACPVDVATITTFSYMDFVLLLNTTALHLGRPAKRMKVHRVNVRTVTAEELGRGAVEAHALQTFYSIADDNGAMAGKLEEFTAELTGPEGAIGGVYATLAQDYLTTANTKEAIASEVHALQATLDVAKFSRSIVFPDDLDSGDVVADASHETLVYTTTHAEVVRKSVVSMKLREFGYSRLVITPAALGFRNRIVRATGWVYSAAGTFSVQLGARRVKGTEDPTFHDNITGALSTFLVPGWYPFSVTVEIPDTAPPVEKFYLYTLGKENDVVTLGDILIEDITQAARVEATLKKDYFTKSDTTSAITSETTKLESAFQVRGTECLKHPTFTRTSDLPMTGPSYFTFTANEMYVGSTAIATITDAAQTAYISMQGSTGPGTYWAGEVNKREYRVTVEFDLESGSLSGAGIMFDWAVSDDAQGTSFFYRTGVEFTTIAQKIAIKGTGTRYRATAVFSRGTEVEKYRFLFNRILLVANHTDAQYAPFTKAVKKIRFHKVSVEALSDEEAGRGLIGAKLEKEYFTQAGVTGAIATEVNRMETNYDQRQFTRNPKFTTTATPTNISYSNNVTVAKLRATSTLVDRDAARMTVTTAGNADMQLLVNPAKLAGRNIRLEAWVRSSAASKVLSFVRLYTNGTDKVYSDVKFSTNITLVPNVWAKISFPIGLADDGRPVYNWVLRFEGAPVGATLDVGDLVYADDTVNANLRATLTEQYLTSSKTDEVIAGKLTTFKSELEAPDGSIGKVSATLTNDYLTKANTTSAIAASTDKLRASVGTSYFSRLLQFPDDMTVSPKTVFSFPEGAFGQYTSQNAALSDRKVVKATMPSTGKVTLRTHLEVPLMLRRRKITARVQGRTENGATAEAVLKLRARRRTSKNDPIIYDEIEGGTVNVAIGVWKEYAISVSLPDSAYPLDSLELVYTGPAGTDVWLGDVLFEGSTVSGEMEALTGSIDSVKALDLNKLAGTAIGSVMEQLGVTAGSNSAGAGSQSTVIADLKKGASAGYLIKASANSTVSLLDLVAADGKGGSKSVAKLSADDIILDGTVGTEKLVVGLGRNLMEDTGFGLGDRNWTRYFSDVQGTETELSLRAAGQPYSGLHFPVLSLYQTGVSNTGTTFVRYRPVSPEGIKGFGAACEEGLWYEASCYVSAARCTADIAIQFFNAAGDLLLHQPGTANVGIQGNSENPDRWERLWAKAKAPAGAQFVTFRLLKSGTHNQSITNSWMRYHKPQIAESSATALRPSAWSPGGTTMIDGGHIVAESLRVTMAEIVDLFVDTLQIADQAIFAEETYTIGDQLITDTNPSSNPKTIMNRTLGDYGKGGLRIAFTGFLDNTHTVDSFAVVIIEINGVEVTRQRFGIRTGGGDSKFVMPISLTAVTKAKKNPSVVVKAYCSSWTGEPDSTGSSSYIRDGMLTVSASKR